MTVYLLLALSIGFEICATAMLNTTNGFKKPGRSVLSILLYYASYITFSKVVIYLNIGVAYAIWSGVGITVTALISRYYFHQRLSRPGKIGMSFVLVGCLVVNL